MAVTSVTVDLNRPEIYALLTDRARRIGNKVQNVARRRAPTDTGKLAASIHVVVGSAPGFVFADIGTNLDYGLYTHEGTGIYGSGRPIRPVRARVMRFRPGKTPRPQTDGFRRARRDQRTWQFAKEVKGQPSKPYLVSALRDVVGSAGRVRMFARRGRRGR